MADTVFIHSIIASFFFRYQNYQSFNSHNPFYRLINYTFFFAHGHETFFVQIVRLYFFLFSDCMEPSRGLSSSLRTSSYTNSHTILDKLVYCLVLLPMAMQRKNIVPTPAISQTASEVPPMNEDQFEREKLYQASMNMFQAMLKDGIKAHLTYKRSGGFHSAGAFFMI